MRRMVEHVGNSRIDSVSHTGLSDSILQIHLEEYLSLQAEGLERTKMQC